ncbi:MAG: cyanophycin synthetase, partial [Verrucomicrobiota bacterium]
RAGGIEVTPPAIERGLADVSWPGRFQTIENQKSKIKNPVILDGAHNEAAAQRLALTWHEVFGGEKCVIILGILKDKEMTAICRALLPVAAAFVLLPVHSQRTSQPEELQSILRNLDPQVDCTLAAGFQEALTIASLRPEKILVTGSLFLVGEALSHFEEAGSKPEMSTQ